MTTIATDGKIVAADTLGCYGSERINAEITKIRRRHGRIYAAAGYAALIDPLIEWHNAGADPDKAPKPPANQYWSILVIDGAKMLFFTSEVPYPDEVWPPFALGAGADHAMGAMWAGKPPDEAVKICCERLTHTGGSVQVVEIEAQAIAAK